MLLADWLLRGLLLDCSYISYIYQNNYEGGTRGVFGVGMGSAQKGTGYFIFYSCPNFLCCYCTRKARGTVLWECHPSINEP